MPRHMEVAVEQSERIQRLNFYFQIMKEKEKSFPSLFTLNSDFINQYIS